MTIMQSIKLLGIKLKIKKNTGRLISVQYQLKKGNIQDDTYLRTKEHQFY